VIAFLQVNNYIYCGKKFLKVEHFLKSIRNVWKRVDCCACFKSRIRSLWINIEVYLILISNWATVSDFNTRLIREKTVCRFYFKGIILAILFTFESSQIQKHFICAFHTNISITPDNATFNLFIFNWDIRQSKISIEFIPSSTILNYSFFPEEYNCLSTF
jgi:hypothetical protein